MDTHAYNLRQIHSLEALHTKLCNNHCWLQHNTSYYYNVPQSSLFSAPQQLQQLPQKVLHSKTVLVAITRPFTFP